MRVARSRGCLALHSTTTERMSEEYRSMREEHKECEEGHEECGGAEGHKHSRAYNTWEVIQRRVRRVFEGGGAYQGS